MQKWVLFFSILILGAGSFFVYKFLEMSPVSAVEVVELPEEELVETPSVEKIVKKIVKDRESKILKEGENDVSFGNRNEINILLLGLDSRKSQKSPRCDSIHMVGLDLKNWTMKITSVPRGTYVYIPPGTYPASESYVANSCYYAGLDYGVDRIERIVGVKSDYVVTAGFSQVLGLARIFKLPTTETLQWLRHRQSYAGGEHQRTYNQAVFIKDGIIKYLPQFRNDFSIPMQYVMYKMVDTDMDFKTVRTIIDGYVKSKIDERPDDIVLNMKPSYPVREIHFNPENAEEQIQEIVDFLKPLLSEDDLSLRSIDSIQKELVLFLDKRLESGDPIDDIVEKQLWLQVEDRDDRERLQFEYLKRLLDGKDNQEVIDMVSDYILEKETLGEKEYAEFGKNLLQTYMESVIQ